MKRILIVLVSCVLFASCATTLTREEQYPRIYSEKPVSILIMPPINNTTIVDAKELFYNSLATPLCEKGYYVISPLLSKDLLQQESAYDAEMFLERDLNPFQKIFGADAALFTIIKDYRKTTLANHISVKVEYILRSTHTGKVLFEREGDIVVKTNTEVGGLIGLVANLVSTATTDKIVGARACNFFVLSDLPDGKYAPNYGKDKRVKAGKKYIKATVKK